MIASETSFDPSGGSFEFADRVILDGFAARQAQQIETLQTILKENERLRQALVTIRINAMRSTPKTRAALVSFCDMGLREVLAGSTLQEAFKVWDVYQKCSSCGAAAAMLGNGICFECTPEGEWPTSGIEARSDETPQEVWPEGQEPGGDSRDAQPSSNNAAVCTAAPQCNPSPQARQDMRATSTVRRAQKGSHHD